MRDRIRLTFYWPTLTSDTKTYCSRCVICYNNARVTAWDRTPIVAVPRAQYSFQEFYVDCAGPSFPKKTSAYNDFIVLCDSATLFSFALPLRSLSANNATEALIKTWTITGVPETVIWDNASFTRVSTCASCLIGYSVKSAFLRLANLKVTLRLRDWW